MTNHTTARDEAQALARQEIATHNALILDTETTGLYTDAEIVQIAVIWLSDGSTAFASLGGYPQHGRSD
jgi:DNA polymerase III epsilon subunit-like protein